MTIKLITFIAGVIATVNFINAGDNVKKMLSSGFILLTLAALARIYF